MFQIGDKVRVTTDAISSHRGQVAEVIDRDDWEESCTVRFDDHTEETIAEDALEEIEHTQGDETGQDRVPERPQSWDQDQGGETNRSPLRLAVDEAGADDWLDLGYVFFQDGGTLKATTDWTSFLTVPHAQPADPPPAGKYPTWSIAGAGEYTHGASGSASSSSSSSSWASSSSGVAPTGDPADWESAQWQQAVAAAGLQPWADKGYIFFYDGPTLKCTMHWSDFFAAGRATYPPPAGFYATWSKDGGTGEAGYHPEPDETEEADDSDVDEDEMVAWSLRNRKPDEKEKEKEKSSTARRPQRQRFNQDTQGYLLADGENVMVNGCWVYQANDGSLWAADTGGSNYRVLRGSAAVPGVEGLRFEGRLATVSADPLSLDGWEFAWGVVIADADKYAEDAWADFRSSITALRISNIDNYQYYAYVEDIGGYPAHISVLATDVRNELKKLLVRGRHPSAGCLIGCNFHVTVEVEGPYSNRNPHVYDNQTQWQGKLADRMAQIETQTALNKGRNWLRSNM